MKSIDVLVITIILILMTALFSVAITGTIPKVVNHTSKLTASKARKRQTKALNGIIKDWNELIIKAVDRGQSGTYIDYYSKSYPKTALDCTVRYFKSKGFDVDYTSQGAHISWNEEEQCWK